MSGSDFLLIFSAPVTTSMIPDFLVDLSIDIKLLDQTLSKPKLPVRHNTTTPEREFLAISQALMSIILALILSDKMVDGPFPRKTSSLMLMELR
jgi:hypothetical protein